MKLGVVFPQTEIGTDPVAIRDYLQAVEEMGYDHVVLFDHVVNADTSTRPGWAGAYRLGDQFHEPFVTFGYAAAVTKRLGLVTGVVILPQRQTALVAKQAAAVDVLSGGRLRLGVGVGWNEVEYEALGADFDTRGKHQEEQIEVLRALWTRRSVTFEGRWHRLDRVGLDPPPVQRPIPIWLGGRSDATLARVAAIADGWFPMGPLDAAMRASLERVRALAAEAGRDTAAIGVEAAISIARDPEREWRGIADAWNGVQATHLMVNTMRAGLRTPDDHIEAVRRVRAALV
ncbi:MAG: LLM class F420-dependent oxidoreductase [SAR202 cluster bacterium]|nr:LLM class F420-dependent oxidoreductase [SAR202 cluster bacterium]